jgi:hypothetical protein
MKRKRDLSTYSISAHPCHGCPFAGKEPIELAPGRLKYYCEQLLNGGSQHICHSAKKTICRGGRTIQLRWFYSLGLITEPTDKAFNQAIAGAKK